MKERFGKSKFIMGEVINFPTNEFYYHIYVIAYSKDGPVKIGYSNNPPQRLKQLQTGSSKSLKLCGSLGLKNEDLARSIEKIILHYLKENDFLAHGEWYNVSVNSALKILELFPSTSLRNEVLDLLDYGLTNNLINDDNYNDLREIFDLPDDENFVFYNFLKYFL